MVSNPAAGVAKIGSACPFGQEISSVILVTRG